MSVMMFIYLAGISENVVSLLRFVSIAPIILWLLFIGPLIVEEVVTKERAIRITICFVIVSLLLGSFSELIPSKNVIYSMGAVHYGEKALQSETFQRLNDKALKLLEIKMYDLLEEKSK